MNLVCSWSGGKDSCYALMLSKEKGYAPKVLLNMMNENGKVSRSHGLPLEILNQQAKQMNLPLVAIPATWNDYETKFINALSNIKTSEDINFAVFGDIDLEPHREWEEKVCKVAEIKPLLPLWKQNRLALVFEMLDAGIETMIVSCNKLMGEKYLGKTLTRKLVLELESIGIDPCGENGEYHTLVVDCPLFSERISLPDYKTQTYNDYCFITWEI